MQPEIEVKFLEVDHDIVRAKLKELGAICEHPMRLMRRAQFDYPDNRFQENNHSRRMRVRDEGDKVMLNFKSKTASNYVDEIETTVGSYDTAVEFFEAIGLKAFSIQESRRETWKYHDVEVVLDEWPWLDTYIEIEGKSEAAIQKVAADLGFSWSDAEYGSVDTAYKHQYPKMKKAESIGDLPEVRFNTPLPKYFEDRK